jgi:hypothetical protein
MNPRRLIEETSDPTEALLLRAVKSEQLSGERRQQILASFPPLGAAPGTPGENTLSTESGSLAAKSAAEQAALVAKASLFHAVSVKWVGVCALALIPVAVVMARHRGPASVGGSSSAALAAPPSMPSMALAVGDVAVQELSPEALAPATTSANRVAMQSPPSAQSIQSMPSTRPNAVDAPAPSSLSQEVAALKEVRRTLARHDAAGALRALDRYARRFGAGRLGPEAVALRIEALAMQGDLAAANALADRFESEHPESPYRVRLRSILSAAATR